MDLPIGVFDSGIGGLSVLTVLKQELPHEDFIYIGDNANNPVGNRTPEEIEALALAIGRKLAAMPVKMLVIACNTFTVIAGEILSRELKIPVVGMMQGVSDSLSVTEGTIGIMATAATIESHKHKIAIAGKLKDAKKHIRIIEQPCPDLAACIEGGHLEDQALKDMARGYLKPLMGAQVDTIILGCTHYPLIQRVLASMYPVNYVDPAYETAAAVMEELTYGDRQHKGWTRIYFTKDADLVQPIVERIFPGEKITVELITL